MEEARARMIVPRDYGWFKIDTIVRYFFPGSGRSSNRPIRTTSHRSVGERDVLGHNISVSMLMISSPAMFALSLSSCILYCSTTPGCKLSAGVAQMRASCAAMSAGPFGKRRAREPVPMLSMERRNRPLRSALKCTTQYCDDADGGGAY